MKDDIECFFENAEQRLIAFQVLLPSNIVFWRARIIGFLFNTPLVRQAFGPGIGEWTHKEYIRSIALIWWESAKRLAYEIRTGIESRESAIEKLEYSGYSKENIDQIFGLVDQLL